jgi:hypothetical protein
VTYSQKKSLRFPGLGPHHRRPAADDAAPPGGLSHSREPAANLSRPSRFLSPAGTTERESILVRDQRHVHENLRDKPAEPHVAPPLGTSRAEPDGSIPRDRAVLLPRCRNARIRAATGRCRKSHRVSGELRLAGTGVGERCGRRAGRIRSPVSCGRSRTGPLSRSVVRVAEENREGRLIRAAGPGERLGSPARCGIAGGGPSVVPARTGKAAATSP